MSRSTPTQPARALRAPRHSAIGLPMGLGLCVLGWIVPLPIETAATGAGAAGAIDHRALAASVSCRPSRPDSAWKSSSASRARMPAMACTSPTSSCPIPKWRPAHGCWPPPAPATPPPCGTIIRSWTRFMGRTAFARVANPFARRESSARCPGATSRRRSTRGYPFVVVSVDAETWCWWTLDQVKRFGSERLPLGPAIDGQGSWRRPIASLP